MNRWSLKILCVIVLSNMMLLSSVEGKNESIWKLGKEKKNPPKIPHGHICVELFLSLDRFGRSKATGGTGVST